jgi:hypothetical protein
MDLVLLNRNIARLRRDVRATIFRNRAADCIGITLERRWYVLSRALSLCRRIVAISICTVRWTCDRKPS